MQHIIRILADIRIGAILTSLMIAKFEVNGNGVTLKRAIIRLMKLTTVLRSLEQRSQDLEEPHLDVSLLRTRGNCLRHRYREGGQQSI